jgi:hypothetical protein
MTLTRHTPSATVRATGTRRAGTWTVLLIAPTGARATGTGTRVATAIHAAAGKLRSVEGGRQ